MKKIVWIGLTIMILALVAAQCVVVTPPAPAADQPAAEEAVAEEPAAEEPEEMGFDWRQVEGEEITVFLSETPMAVAIREHIDEFTEQTGIEVRLIEAGADELIERIQSEGEFSSADLLITVDAGRLWRAEQAGIFEPVSSGVLEARLPDYLRHPDGLWFGL